MSPKAVRQQKSAVTNIWRYVDIIQSFALFTLGTVVVATFIYLLVID